MLTLTKTVYDGHRPSIRYSSLAGEIQLPQTSPIRKIQDIKVVGRVFACSFSPDDKLLLVCGEDSQARIFNVQTSGLQCTFPYTKLEFPKGEKYVSLGGQNLPNGSREKPGRDIKTEFSPGGRSVAIPQADGTIEIRDLQGTLVRKFWGAMEGPTGTSLSYDGCMLLVKHVDEFVVWDLRADHPTCRIPNESLDWYVKGSAFSPDNTKLLLRDQPDYISLYDVASGKLERRFKIDKEKLQAFGFTEKGKDVFTLGSDWVDRWSADTGESHGRFTLDLNSQNMIMGRNMAALETNVPVDFIYGDHSIAHMVPPASFELSQAFNRETLHTFRWAPFASVASNGETAIWMNDAGKLSLGDVHAKEALVLSEAMDTPIGVGFASHESVALSATWAGGVKLWDKSTGKLLCTLVDFKGGGWAVLGPWDTFDGSNNGNFFGVVLTTDWGAGVELTSGEPEFYKPGLLRDILR